MVDLAWIVPVVTVLNFFLLMAWRIYSSRKSFRDQFAPMNRQILAVLMEDFYDDMADWSQELKKKIKKEELGKIVDSLGGLFKKSEKLSLWNNHITRGAELLKGTSSDLVFVGVFWTIAIVIYALLADQDVYLAFLIALLVGYGGLILLMRGIGKWREYCKIESRIDKKYTALTFGRSKVTSEDEDEED